MRAIPQTEAIALLRALAPLGEDPRRGDRDIKRLAGPRELYRLRVGSYRIVYAILDERLIVLVATVGGRGQVYRDLGRM
jgi:mRNA interferase RelE/StbE